MRTRRPYLWQQRVFARRPKRSTRTFQAGPNSRQRPDTRLRQTRSAQPLRATGQSPAIADGAAKTGRSRAEVTVAAFRTLAVSHHTEQFIIAALRAAGALTVSLVAEENGRVIGHIAFSPVTLSDGTRHWYGLGPVSVQPEYQRRGIGKALVREGLSRLKNMNARGCCLVGHPDYYTRFGFRHSPGLVLEGVPQEFFFALPLDGHVPQGTVTFHDAFKADA